MAGSRLSVLVELHYVDGSGGWATFAWFPRIAETDLEDLRRSPGHWGPTGEISWAPKGLGNVLNLDYASPNPRVC